MNKSFYLIIILSLFVYCGPRYEEVERIMEDGVEVVINHLEPYKINGQPISLHLEKVYSIDTENDSIAELGLTDLWATNVDPDGNMYLWNAPIPNRKENLVYKFDSNGNFQKSFLKIGQGPGEVQSPTLPIITESGVFVITDYFPRKLLYLNFDGGMTNEVSFESQIFYVYPLENGNFFAEEIRRFPDHAYSDYLMVLYNPEMKEAQQLMHYRDADQRKAAKIKGTLTIDDRALFKLWAISKGKIYVGNNDQAEYEILVYDYEGHLIWKIRKEYTPVEVSEEFKRKILDRYEKQPYGFVKDMAKRIYFPKYMPPYQSFFCDDEGRLFVMTFEEKEDSGEFICDIFDTEGRFISRVGIGNYANWDMIIPNQFVVIAKKNRIHCIQEKDRGYKELVVYRMNWE